MTIDFNMMLSEWFDASHDLQIIIQEAENIIDLLEKDRNYKVKNDTFIQIDNIINKLISLRLISTELKSTDYDPVHRIFWVLSVLFKNDWLFDWDIDAHVRVSHLLERWYELTNQRFVWDIIEQTKAHLHGIENAKYRRPEDYISFIMTDNWDIDPIEEFRIIEACFDILVSNKSMTADQMSSYLDNFSSRRDTVYIKLYQAFINWELEEDIEIFIWISDLLIQYFTRKKDVKLAEKVQERIQSYLS